MSCQQEILHQIHICSVGPHGVACDLVQGLPRVLAERYADPMGEDMLHQRMCYTQCVA